MYDIVKYETDKLHSYEKTKNKIIRCKDIKEAREHWNKKQLVLLEDYSFDEGLMKQIALKKKICVIIDLSRVISSYGVKRAIELTRLRNFLRLSNKFGLFYTFVTFEKEEKHQRSREEMISIASLFGNNQGQTEFALEMLKHYV